MQTVLLSLLATSGFGVFACGDYTPQFQHEGRARVAQLGEHTATLQGTCHMWGRRTFELELHLYGVAPQDLSLDDPADRGTAPMQPDAVTLGWTTASQRTHLVAATTQQRFSSHAPLRAGEPDGPEHVVVMLDDISSSENGVDFFGVLAAEPGNFSWRQNGASDAETHIRASFAFNAADAIALRNAALACRSAKQDMSAAQ